MFVAINRIYETAIEQNKSHLLEGLTQTIGKYTSEPLSTIEGEVNASFIESFEKELVNHATLINRKLEAVENHYQDIKDRHGITILLNSILRQEDMGYLHGLISPFLKHIAYYCLSFEPHIRISEMQSDIKSFLKAELDNVSGFILEHLKQVIMQIKENGYYNEEPLLVEETKEKEAMEDTFNSLFETPYDALLAELNENFSIDQQKIVADLEKASKYEEETMYEQGDEKSGLSL